MSGMDTSTANHDIRPAYRSAIDVLDVAVLELWERIDDLLQAKRHLQGLDADDAESPTPAPAPSIAEPGTPVTPPVDDMPRSAAAVTPRMAAADLVVCEDCGKSFHRNGIGPHRRKHRDTVVTVAAVFDHDRARAAAADSAWAS